MHLTRTKIIKIFGKQDSIIFHQNSLLPVFVPWLQ
jgi:hypothetical protein